jgi:hypothetical protein
MDFEIYNGINEVTGVTERIVFKGMALDVGYNGKAFITIHYVFETIANGVLLTTQNGGYRLDQDAISIDKFGTILPKLDSEGNPMLDEEENIIPRVDACTQFITMLYAGFFNTLKAGILEYENKI